MEPSDCDYKIYRRFNDPGDAHYLTFSCYRHQQGGGYDRNIRSRKELWEKIDYIHANPVRKGSCEHPADWKWSSAAQYYEASDGSLKLDLSDLPERI